jgi:hypothetical protein
MPQFSGPQKSLVCKLPIRYEIMHLKFMIADVKCQPTPQFFLLQVCMQVLAY